MKTEWKFHYYAYDFVFGKEVKYKGHLRKWETGEEVGPFRFHFVPAADALDDHKIVEHGDLKITSPFNYEDSKAIVNEMLFHTTEQIKYKYGKITISASYTGERIPETEEEAAAIGEGKYFAGFSVTEVPTPRQFDPDTLSGINPNTELVAQFNHAVEANHVIEQYTGLFKIFESRYVGDTRKTKTSEYLKNDELKSVFQKAFQGSTSNDFAVFIDSLVKVRGLCSHIKKDKYGLYPHDPEVESEVRPMKEKLQHLARAFIDTIRD